MIPVTQTKMVVKNANGDMMVRGNCYAAAIASILEMQITDVPNVETLFHIEKSYWAEVMHTFLNSIGWELMTDDRFKSFHTVFNDDNYSELAKMQEQVMDKLYLVSGQSPRGVMHMCIFKNGHLIHDPHPSRGGISTYEYFETLEKNPETKFSKSQLEMLMNPPTPEEIRKSINYADPSLNILLK